MKKSIKDKKKVMFMCQDAGKTFKEGFDEFLLNCKSRNLREDTIWHYEKAYRIISPYIDPDKEISTINKSTVDNFIIEFGKKDIASQTLHSYTKDLATILHFFMDKEYLQRFKMEMPKVDNHPVEIYTDAELQKLLKKPNMKTCNFTEYTNWAIINFFLGTGIRLSSLVNIKIKDIDFDNELCNVVHTKNRKALIIPLNKQLIKVIREYLKYRTQDITNEDDYLFCNSFGEQINKFTLPENIRAYNKRRGVTTTGIHRFRHTFAKKFIINGGSIYTLEKLLGHSSLTVTERYVNLLVTDIQKDINRYNILDEFSKERIKIKK